MAKICVGSIIPHGCSVSKVVPVNITESSTFIVEFSESVKEEDITTDLLIYKSQSSPVVPV